MYQPSFLLEIPIKYANPWNYEHVYLSYLARVAVKSVNDYNPWYLKGLECREVLIKKFMDSGHLRLATVEELIERKLTGEDLKRELKNRGAKVTGLKKDLVSRLMSLLDTEQIKTYEEESFFALTPSGFDIVEASNDKVKSEIKKLCEVCQNLIHQGKTEEAFNVLMFIREKAPFSSGMGYNAKFAFNVFSAIIFNRYKDEELECDDVKKSQIKVAIAIHYILDSPGYYMEGVASALLRIWPGFNCNWIKSFLDGEPTGVFQDSDPNNPFDVCQIFNHSVIMRATSQVNLKTFLAWQRNGRFKGVSIIGNMKNCSVCNGKDRNYSWKQIATSPELPQYPGCYCTYVIWAE